MAKTIAIRYAVTYNEQRVTRAEARIVHWMYGDAGNKVRAIKFVREQRGIGLYEAKQVCDAIGELRLDQIEALPESF